METLKQVQAGLLKYIDKEIVPNLAQISEAMLTSLCQKRSAQLIGLVSPEGLVNVDMLRMLALNVIPDAGLTKEVLGVSFTVKRADIDMLCKMIKEA